LAAIALSGSPARFGGSPTVPAVSAGRLDGSLGGAFSPVQEVIVNTREITATEQRTPFVNDFISSSPP
jgi:hypothetical protein